MATIAPAGTGYYDVGATWVGGVVPASTDTIDFSGTTHEVTLRDAQTIGLSGAEGVNAVNLSGSTFVAKLIIASGGVLTCRGDFLHGDYGFLEIQPGGILKFDSTASSSPTTIGYALKDTGTSVFRHLIVSGSSHGARGLITSDVTGGAKKGRIAYSNSQVYYDIAWARFSNLASIQMNAGYSQVLANVIIDDTCGAVTLGVHQGAQPWTLLNVQNNSTSTMMLDDATVPTSGARTMTNVAARGVIDLRSREWALSNVVAAQGIIAGTGDGSTSSWSDVFLRITNVQGLPSGTALAEKTVLFYDDAAENNAHWAGWNVSHLPAEVVMDRWLVYGHVSGGAGDIFFPPGGGITMKLRRSIGLFNPDGSQPGCWANVNLGTAAIDCEHCTIPVDNGQTGVAVAENNVTPAGAVDANQSNIFYRKTLGGGAAFTRMTSGGAEYSDITVPSRTGNNGFVNVNAAPLGANEVVRPQYAGFSNAVPVFSTAPSADTTDVYVTGSPFVDWDRDLRSYAVARGLASGGDTDTQKTDALIDALMAIANVDDPNYDAAVTIEDILTYHEAGLTPTDATLQAAHDGEVGGWMGAVEGTDDLTADAGVATATASAQTPAVTLGAITATAGVAVAAASAQVPSITLGGLTTTPSAAIATASAQAPSVTLAGTLATPNAATATATGAAPSVTLGGITATPGVATASAVASTPSITLGGLTVVAGVAIAVALALGATSVVAGAAAALGLITAVLTWKARYNADLTGKTRHNADLTHLTDD